MFTSTTLLQEAKETHLIFKCGRDDNALVSEKADADRAVNTFWRVLAKFWSRETHGYRRNRCAAGGPSKDRVGMDSVKTFHTHRLDNMRGKSTEASGGDGRTVEAAGNLVCRTSPDLL